MPQLVPRELYPNAVTWNSTLWETASIGGPALGGFLYGFLGITASYLTDVLLMAGGLLLVIGVSKKPLPQTTDEQGVVEKIRSGLRFVFRNPIILSAISLDLFAVLFGGAVALLPIFADEILMVGKEGLGYLTISAFRRRTVNGSLYNTPSNHEKHGQNSIVLCCRFWCEHDIFCPVDKLLAFIIFIDVEWNV